MKKRKRFALGGLAMSGTGIDPSLNPTFQPGVIPPQNQPFMAAPVRPPLVKSVDKTLGQPMPPGMMYPQPTPQQAPRGGLGMFAQSLGNGPNSGFSARGMPGRYGTNGGAPNGLLRTADDAIGRFGNRLNRLRGSVDMTGDMRHPMPVNPNGPPYAFMAKGGSIGKVFGEDLFEVMGVKGVRSIPFRKGFKTDRARQKWLDANEGDLGDLRFRDPEPKEPDEPTPEEHKFAKGGFFSRGFEKTSGQLGAMARAMKTAHDAIFEESDEPDLRSAYHALKQVPGTEGLQSRIEQLHEQDPNEVDPAEWQELQAEFEATAKKIFGEGD